MAREMKDSGVPWIGEIPADWDMVPLQYYVELNKSTLGENTPTNYEFEYVEIGAVTLEKGISEYQHYKFSDAPSRARRIARPGDIIISTVRTYLKAIATVPDKENVVVSTGFAVLTPKKICADYLGFTLKSEYFAHMVASYSVGISYPAINSSDLVKIKVPIATKEEQIGIAGYLNKKCAEIDGAVEKIKATVEEYKKLKQAIITQAVTKGIRGDRPMKDSRIEWVGSVPKDWRIQRIKTIFNLRDERNYLPLQEVNLISLYTDKGVVQHADLEATTGNKASNADGYKLVYENDIVVYIILCWMGAIGCSAYSGVTSPAYDVYAASDEIDSWFYHYYFRTVGFSGDCYKRGRGIMAMRWRTYSDQFRDIRAVVPPLQEQKEIVEFLNAKCNEIDRLIEKKQALLDEIENYKKSLIYEYITGKRELNENAH